jgi:hypothetical protein
VTLADGNTWLRTLSAAQRMLARDFAIDHVTLQPAWPPPPGIIARDSVSPVAEGEPGRRLH